MKVPKFALTWAPPPQALSFWEEAFDLRLNSYNHSKVSRNSPFQEDTDKFLNDSENKIKVEGHFSLEIDTHTDNSMTIDAHN